MISNEDSTIWSIANHTVAKHEILKKYLEAWIPILGKRDRIVFLDGFAGPGVYKGGEDGSPIIAIETAMKHSAIKNIKEINFIFIEKNKKRYENLRQIIAKKFPKPAQNIKIRCIHGDFAKSCSKVLDEFEKDGKGLDRILAFLDPFGYSDVPFDLISRILKYPKCELLLTFMHGYMIRFLHELHENAVNTLFKTNLLEEAGHIKNTDERLKRLLEIFFEQLEEIDIKFIRSFTMRDSNKKTIYDLIFATKHWKGMDEMKKAMLNVQKNGTYTYSDNIDNDQTYLVDINDDFSANEASQSIVKQFSGQTVPIEDIRDFILAKTRFRFSIRNLQNMEKKKKLIIVEEGNTSRYSHGCTIKFTSGHTANLSNWMKS